MESRQRIFHLIDRLLRVTRYAKTQFPCGSVFNVANVSETLRAAINASNLLSLHVFPFQQKTAVTASGSHRDHTHFRAVRGSNLWGSHRDCPARIAELDERRLRVTHKNQSRERWFSTVSGTVLAEPHRRLTAELASREGRLEGDHWQRQTVYKNSGLRGDTPMLDKSRFRGFPSFRVKTCSASSSKDSSR